MIGRAAQDIRDANTSLRRTFTNAEQALQVFRSIIAHDRADTSVLAIHGLGGVGKSTLLKMYELISLDNQVPVASVSADSDGTILDVFRKWAEQLRQRGLPLRRFGSALKRYDATGQKVVQASQNVGVTNSAITTGLLEAALTQVPFVGQFLGKGAKDVLQALTAITSREDAHLFLDANTILAHALIQDLQQSPKAKRIVLILDAFERLKPFENPLVEFVSRLPNNILVVLGGRYPPGRQWERTWPDWVAHTHSHELHPMSEVHMRELTQKHYAIIGQSPKAEQVDEIVRFARGLPLVVQTAVRLSAEFGMTEFRMIKPTVEADLIDRILETTSPDFHSILFAAASLRWFDRELVEVVVGRPVSEGEYTQLRHWEFVRPRVEGLAIHDLMRSIINGRMRADTPSLFVGMHNRAAEYFRTRLERDTGSTRDLGEFLYHRLLASEKDGLQELKAAADRLAAGCRIEDLRTVLSVVGQAEELQTASRNWFLFYRARVQALVGDVREVERNLSELSRKTVDDRELMAYVGCEQSWVYTRWERLGEAGGVERAISTIDSSMEWLSRDVKLAQLYLYRARVHEYRGEWEDAIECLTKGEELYETAGDAVGKVFATMGRIAAYALHGSWDELIAVRKSLLSSLGAEVDHKYLHAKVLGYWTWALVMAGHYQAAEKDIRRAIQLAGGLGDPTLNATLFRNLGLALGLQERYRDAEANFEEALRCAPDINHGLDEHRATTKTLRGLVLLRAGELEAARSCLEQCCLEKTSINDHLGLAEALNWLGSAYAALGEWSTSQETYERSLTWSWAGRRYCTIEAKVGQARAWAALGHVKKAEAAIQEVEARALALGYWDLLSEIHLLRAEWRLARVRRKGTAGYRSVAAELQNALLSALRFNRYLLDRSSDRIRKLLGRHGDVGEELLAELRRFWVSGLPDEWRAAQLHHGSEGVSASDVEASIRRLEPGDGTPQRSVLERLRWTPGAREA